MSLHGCRLLITGGPTRAYLDAVRYITNESSGRLGARLAGLAVERGAEVHYVRGCGSALPVAAPGGGVAPAGTPSAGRLAVTEIETVDDLLALVEREIGQDRYDAMIHSMAVLDFTPAETRPGKVASRSGDWLVRLVPTPKVIERVRALDPDIFLVGFKLEVGLDDAGLASAARAAAERSGADLIVANALESVRSGEHRAVLVGAGGAPVEAAAGKEDIARRVLDRVEQALARRRA